MYISFYLYILYFENTYTRASISDVILGEVHPNISPGERGFAWGTIVFGYSFNKAFLAT